MPVPDWQLPEGVDRGLWDYLHSAEMAAGYDEQMAGSPLAQTDVVFCEKWFPSPGRLLDMGCGTGRLCRHFAAKGYDCVGVDLSEEMLQQARAQPHSSGIEYREGNLLDLADLHDASFDYAACLFSTLGMVRGYENQVKLLKSAYRLLKPGGRFVLHVHNRYFLGLGWRNWDRGDITMPQAYAGAPLTLRHYSLFEAGQLLAMADFDVGCEVMALGIDGKKARWPRALRAYGYLIACQK
ncbi:MAG TPA: class I SAM-dependent methyltransferase [Gemmataceae bacterium]|jgi:SAM-dependent methyltransferase